MKTILALVLFLSFALYACAPSPTPVPPTAASAATAAPARPTITAAPKTAAPNTALVVQNSRNEKSADGNRTTGEIVTDDKLSVGQMDVGYPDKMVMGESRPVVLKIVPSAQLTSLRTAPALGKTPDFPDTVFRVSNRVDIYPVMYAELRAVNFEVEPKGLQRRIIQSASETMTWSWVISPRSAGQQALALELSIPIIVGGNRSELSTSVLQNIPFVVAVQAPAPTPVPMGDQVMKSIADNAGAIIIALIGLIGTILGLVAKARSGSKGN